MGLSSLPEIEQTKILNTSNVSIPDIEPKSKHRKMGEIFISILSILLVTFFLRPTVVVDGETFLPINGANVKYASYGWNGCLNKANHNTFLGITFSVGVFFPCQITVSKNGYHTNGVNEITSLPAFLGLKIIKLNKIKNPQEFIQFTRVFVLEKPNMDVSPFLYNLDPNDIKVGKDYDFTFNVIDNEAKEANILGRTILEIEFLGQGGVQEISKDSTKNDLRAEYYDMQNLLEAPISGYQKKISIEVGKAYVARLKDGAHYMKFHVSGSKKDGKLFACMTGYIQPRATTNLEFPNIYENILCFKDSNSLD
ncbi:MAG: hypothetical protein KBC06_01165 [Candidatus Pacebacteria bacterium]|nr:hypothetical protein [Candidatus Paceibacterota bacterium]